MRQETEKLPEAEEMIGNNKHTDNSILNIETTASNNSFTPGLQFHS